MTMSPHDAERRAFTVASAAIHGMFTRASQDGIGRPLEKDASAAAAGIVFAVSTPHYWRPSLKIHDAEGRDARFFCFLSKRERR